MTATHEHVTRTRRLAVGLVLLPLVFGTGAAAIGAESTPKAGDEPSKSKPVAEDAKDADVAEAIKKEVIVDPDDVPPSPEKSESAPKKGPPGKPIGDGMREMTLDEIRDLPVLKRLDLPFEKGEQWLSDVKDYTYHYDESALWWLVHLVAKLPPEAFKPDETPTGHLELLAMPSAHRGKPVTIRGAYVSASWLTTPVLALRKDIPMLYVCNIRGLPANEKRPFATVLVIEDPTTYLEKYDTVRVKGYFYKIRRYEDSQGNRHDGPMLVARRLDLEERSPDSLYAGPGMSKDQILLAFMIALVVMLGLVFLWLRHRTKVRFHAASTHPIHRFRLRRPDRVEPPADAGDGGEGREPQP